MTGNKGAAMTFDIGAIRLIPPKKAIDNGSMASPALNVGTAIRKIPKTGAGTAEADRLSIEAISAKEEKGRQ